MRAKRIILRVNESNFHVHYNTSILSTELCGNIAPYLSVILQVITPGSFFQNLEQLNWTIQAASLTRESVQFLH